MNYRDELYLNIIRKYYKKYHKVPLNEELQRMGINVKYITLKYGSIKNFYKESKITIVHLKGSGAFGKYYGKPAQIYYIYNKNKKELIDRGRYTDLFFDYMFDLGTSFMQIKDKYINIKPYRGLIVLGEWQHRVYDLCDRDYRSYLVAMYFLFDTDIFKNIQSSTTKKWYESIIKPIGDGTKHIEEFLGDISRFDETIQYMKDFKAGKIILRDYDKYGKDVERLKTPDEVNQYMEKYLKERRKK